MADMAWTGSIRCRCGSALDADRLIRALGPEVAREVPRARAALRREGTETVVIELGARDTGALRAAVQTYLGWLQLTEATDAVAEP